MAKHITEWYIKYDPIPLRINGNRDNVVCVGRKSEGICTSGSLGRRGSGLEFGDSSLYVLFLQGFNFM